MSKTTGYEHNGWVWKIVRHQIQPTLWLADGSIYYSFGKPYPDLYLVKGLYITSTGCAPWWNQTLVWSATSTYISIILMALNLLMRKVELGTSCLTSRCHFVMNFSKLPTRKNYHQKIFLKLAPNEDRTRDLTLTKRMLCQLSYEGNKGISNPYSDFDHGLDSRSNVRRPGIGAITSSCGPKNLGMTPSLGIFFARFRETCVWEKPNQISQSPLNFLVLCRFCVTGFQKCKTFNKENTAWSGIWTHAPKLINA